MELLKLINFSQFYDQHLCVLPTSMVLLHFSPDHHTAPSYRMKSSLSGTNKVAVHLQTVSAVFEKRDAMKELFDLESYWTIVMSMMRMLCIVWMDLKCILMIFQFWFLLHTFNAFLSIQTWFFQYCRGKHWVYSFVWQWWRSFATPLSKRRVEMNKSTRPLCVPQALQLHEQAHSMILVHTNTSSTAIFWEYYY